MKRIAVHVLFMAAGAGFSVAAHADELEDFQLAKNAYESQNYPLAIERFEVLVVGDSPKLKSRPLVLESRKYLAVSYLFAGQRKKAEAQFEALLKEESSYELDPLEFSTEVLDLFTSVRTRLHRERSEAQTLEQKAKEEQQRRAKQAADERSKNLQRLVQLAQTERVEYRHSRWVASLPLGVGQYQNGDETLGTLFLVSELALAAVSLTSFLIHDSLHDVTPSPNQRDNAQFAEEASRITNWAATGALFAVALAGIVEANLNFKPVERTERKREVPRDVFENLSVSASGVKLTF